MNKTLLFLLIATPLLIIILLLLCPLPEVSTPAPEPVSVPVPVPVPVPVQVSEPEIEFRSPPYRKYRPGHYQQVGLLINGSETLPLYGQQLNNVNWNYYTTTPGNQIYSLPITHEGRVCTEDFGCKELYGNETVSVTGRTGTYDVTIYNIDQLVYR